MSCNTCGSTNTSCGCKDQPFTTVMPSICVPECPPKCAEYTNARCVIFTDGIDDIGSKPGDTLESIIQRLTLIITNPLCVDYNPGSGGGGGGGGIIQVGLVAPSNLFATPIVPVTTPGGDLILAYNEQPANTVFAGPTSGAPGDPEFRALVKEDLPPLTTGTSILMGDGAGFFANVTVGTGLDFTGGVLTATATPGNTYTVNNGLSPEIGNDKNFQLGGPLVQNTSILGATNAFDFTFSSIRNFTVSGASSVSVEAIGNLDHKAVEHRFFNDVNNRIANLSSTLGQLTLDGYYAGTGTLYTDDPAYALGVDNLGNVLKVPFNTGATGDITADNGITANTTSNTRLGGPLVQDTQIRGGATEGGPYDLAIGDPGSNDPMATLTLHASTALELNTPNIIANGAGLANGQVFTLIDKTTGEGDWADAFILTTTGTDGAATYDGTTLNIPAYATTYAPASGLSEATGDPQTFWLGGTLLRNTTIDGTASFDMTITSAKNGASTLTVSNTDPSTSSAGSGLTVTSAQGDGIIVSANANGVTSTATTGSAIVGTSSSSSNATAVFTAGTATTQNGVIANTKFIRTSGAAVNGYGQSLDFILATASGGPNRFSNQLISNWTTAADGTRTSQFEIWGVNNAAAIAKKMSIAGNGQLTLDAYTTSTSFTSATGVSLLGVDSLGAVVNSGAVNGLNFHTASSNVKLGGTLIENTTITGSDKSLTMTFDGLTTINGLNITSTSTGAASNNQKLINVVLSGANANSNQVTTAIYGENSHTVGGTSSSNFGVYGLANGAGSVTVGDTSISVGVYGITSTVKGRGVLGVGGTTTTGVEGRGTIGVLGSMTSGGSAGVSATAVSPTSAALSTICTDGLAFRSARNTTVAGDASIVSENTRFIMSAANITTAAGFGTALNFYLQAGTSAVSEVVVSNGLISKWTDAGNTTRTSQFEIQGVNNGAAISTQLTVKGTGQLQLNKYIASNSFTGTATGILAYDTSGNVITSPVPASGGAMTVYTPTINVERTNNLSPASWSGSTSDSSLIKITTANGGSGWVLGTGTGGSYNILSGLVAKPAGSIVTIVNSGTNNLLIIEHNNTTDSTASNTFKMVDRMAYFVMPGRSVTFYHDGSTWVEMVKGNTGGFDLFDDYLASSYLNASPPPNGTPQAPMAGTYYGSGFMVPYNTGGSTGNFVGSSASTTAPNFIYGAVGLNTGAGTAGMASLYMASNQGQSLGNGFGSLSTTRLHLGVSRFLLNAKPSAADDFRFAMGVTGNFNTTGLGVTSNAQFHAGWYLDTFANDPTGEMKMKLNGLTTFSAITPLIPSANTWYTLGQYVDSLGHSSYFYAVDPTAGSGTPQRYTFGNYVPQPTAAKGGFYGIGISKAGGTIGTTPMVGLIDYTGISTEMPQIIR